MKKAFLCLFVLLAFLIYSIAEIPAGYYDNALGKTGDELEQALRTIISTGYVYHSYDSSRAQMYGYIDNFDGWVSCVYSNESFYLGQGGGPDPADLNCEHTYCQSWFGYDSGDMKSDVHHLFPTTPSVNSSRNNRPLDNVTSVTSTWGTGDYISYTGKNSSGQNVFEPADRHKGDAARAIFYFIVRYDRDLHSDILNATTVNIDIMPTLMNWHVLDPVSQKEINRNDDIYSFQNNRNPFVDHPEYVEYIWGSGVPESEPPEFEGITTCDPTGTSGQLYLAWNPASDQSPPVTYNIYISTIALGQNFSVPSYSTNDNWYTASDLSDDTTYYVIVRAKDSWGNEENNSIEISGTPTDESVPDTFPPVFSGLSNVIDLKSGNTLKLIWENGVDNEGANPVTYNIYYSVHPGAQHFDAPAQTTANNYFIFDNLNNGQTYYFVVRAQDNLENEDNNTREIMGVPTSVYVEPEISEELSVKIFPNPAKLKNNIRLEVTGQKPVSFKIYSADGKFVIDESYEKVIKINDYAFQIPTANLSSGIYLIIIEDQNYSIIRKFAIIK